MNRIAPGQGRPTPAERWDESRATLMAKLIQLSFQHRNIMTIDFYFQLKVHLSIQFKCKWHKMKNNWHMFSIFKKIMAKTSPRAAKSADSATP
ncbi:hypothetical protein [Chromobacterium phragmitis]|uniref:Uncharacterized protein n=1 Tax=Chromobacterium phragmitis TaxID=2202141 RepID=A0ABV0IZE3_9NEIS|nr:hypothetical protein [Chromobacterium phragmitis]